MRTSWAVAAAAVPPLILAGIGMSHPQVLTPESATWWRDLHVIGLVAFPLLALGPWAAVRAAGGHRLLEALTVVLGVVYAAFYTALDAIAGIGGGATTLAVGPGPWVSALFGVANQVALPGVYAYLLATVVAALAVVAATAGALRWLAAAGGLVAAAGAYTFGTSHIYYPYGVAAMVALALGWTALVVTAGSDQEARGLFDTSR